MKFKMDCKRPATKPTDPYYIFYIYKIRFVFMLFFFFLFTLPRVCARRRLSFPDRSPSHSFAERDFSTLLVKVFISNTTCIIYYTRACSTR